MTNTCKSCAWYCHADGMCYVPKNMSGGYRIIPFNVNFSRCQNWQFDGLEDWEREDCEKSALMAMELA